MTRITSLQARQILDSRGNPTIEVDLQLNSGAKGRASAPSGASTGAREALELRDNDAASYLGKGVLLAVNHVHQKIAPLVTQQDIPSQAALDTLMLELDGSENKSNLGANAILAVSMAFAHALATENKQPLYQQFANDTNTTFILPTPMMNIINGGAHADNNLDIQEFMIIPTGAATFSEALRYGVEVFHSLKALLKHAKLSTAVGDEGGFAPQLSSHTQALDLICESIVQAGFNPGKEIHLALDVASSEFCNQGIYHLTGEQKTFAVDEWIAYLKNWVQHYPLISIEDGMAEDDWAGWAKLTQELGKQLQLVGDDLFVTNPKILAAGIKQGIANAILIKLNQIGTVSETLAAISMAQQAGYATVISHRSGETEDTTIADLAVGTAALQIKTGSLSRSDRVAKYNQLLRIEEQLGSSVRYAGFDPFRK